MSIRPEDVAFSLAHAMIPLDASTCVTCAPAAAHARVAPPVYAKRLRTFICLLASFSLAFFIMPENQSQLAACSGNIPVCLKLKGFKLKVRGTSREGL